MARRSKGIAGSAVLIGTAGLYLVYAGIKDVPFIDGIRDILNQKKPTSRASHSPYDMPDVIRGAQIVAENLAAGPGDTGIDKLVGNARNGYNVIRKAGNWRIGGWGLRSDMSSDHPKGLALDVMTTSEVDAQRIIKIFRGLPGAKYWIWNRQIANIAVDNWRIRPYTGASPHTDHVHLSFS